MIPFGVGRRICPAVGLATHRKSLLDCKAKGHTTNKVKSKFTAEDAAATVGAPSLQEIIKLLCSCFFSIIKLLVRSFILPWYPGRNLSRNRLYPNLSLFPSNPSSPTPHSTLLLKLLSDERSAGYTAFAYGYLTCRSFPHCSWTWLRSLPQVVSQILAPTPGHDHDL
ncbi:hypothetical protein NE237_014371 [Protea cynaroides]|uniref:Cytochrome P450 n=1 Tax=Protea cynaroides TaxID=273540 RepID=A0A9Q0KC11_9MAGN|nr:hypothetical protein NE237_014371 [Protea cynaroides]